MKQSKQRGHLEQSNRPGKMLIVIILLLMALVLAAACSSYRLSHSYELKNTEDASSMVNLVTMEGIYENVDYDAQSGSYIPLNDDPWMLFNGLNQSFKGILIELKEAVSTDIEVKVYWTKEGEDALSESRTVKGKVDRGQNNTYLRLPSYSVNMVRVDIDGECRLDALKLTKSGVSKKTYFGSDFVIATLIRGILIFIVLYLAYLAHIERIRNGSRPVLGLFVDARKEGRRYELDYIRTLAAILVIMMHSVIENYAPSVSIGEPGYRILKMVLAVSLVCNVLYIMLSGALLLKPGNESIGEFYKKRLGKVLIPTVSYYLLYMLQGFHADVFKDGILSGILMIGKGLLTSRPDYMLHMWFIYAILSLYILAPFLRIVISHISERQLFGLILAGFIFDVFASYLPMFGMNFGIDTPIASWMGVFLLGYYMTTEDAKKKYKFFMVLGALGLITTCLLVYYLPQYLYYESNWTPMMWLEGAGVFAFFLYFRKIFGKYNIVIASISKYNFSIMLVHVLLLMKFILPIGWQLEGDYGHLRFFIIGIILVSFVCSYLVSVFYDNTAIIAANYVYGKIMKKSGK